MKRSLQPERLDVATFAAAAGQMAGDWPGAQLVRLAAAQEPPQDLPLEPVRWQAAGALRPVAGGPAEVWLHLQAETAVWLTCQRCLQPMRWPLAIDRPIRFARSEAEAEALDAELEEDVLALTRSLDLGELLEDELLLALPLVPRHGSCPEPLPVAAAQAPPEEGAEAAANPFAVLAGLKGRARPT